MRTRVTPGGDHGHLRRGSGCPQAGDGAENSDSMGHGPSWGLVGLWAQAVGMRAQGTCWGCRAKMVTCGEHVWHRGKHEGHVCGVGDMGTGWVRAAPRSCMDPKGGCMHGAELQAATASNEERCLTRNGASLRCCRLQEEVTLRLEAESTLAAYRQVRARAGSWLHAASPRA